LYNKQDKLDEPVFQALLHLHRYTDAAKFAQDRRMDRAHQAGAQARAGRPLKVTLDKITEVPFADTPTPIVGSLGGISIDGLISHAFLKEYVWTLDFDRMRYVFSHPDR
jgi:hypothetical protein